MTSAIVLWKRAKSGKHGLEEEDDTSSVSQEEHLMMLLARIQEADKHIDFLYKLERESRLNLAIHALEDWIVHRRTLLKMTFGRIGWWPVLVTSQISQQIHSLFQIRTSLVEELGLCIQGHPPSQEYPLIYIPNFGPTWISTLLLPTIGYSLLTILAVNSLKRVDWQAATAFCMDIWQAGRNLIVTWIMNPLWEIWKTIRYKSTNLAIASPGTLMADMESLERMVLDFAHDNRIAIPQQQISLQLKHGDLSFLLRHYEEDMKRPWRGILGGDLIRLILIQVQKSKVDLESAMLALDKLLRSNELNFELMAVLPLMLLVAFSLRSGRSYVGELLRRSDRQLFRKIIRHLREIEVILNSECSDNTKFGELFVHVQAILDSWSALSKCIQSRHTEEFFTDLTELLSTLPAERKLWTIVRMHHSFYFLQSIQ